MSAPLTCTAAIDALKKGETTPTALVEACLQQIDRFEARVRAWVLVDAEGARRAAAEMTDELRRGQSRGALHGIPIGIKDIVDVAGWPTEAGSPLRKGWTAPHDAPIVARLRAAGAILLGKTVTTEYASFDPPPTRNPWSLERTPGGSSSGSAAGVAVGMCLAAIGSQTGGSITRPASFCGVAGFKPAWGTVPLAGIVPLSPHLDHPGPIARSVADLRLIHNVIVDAAPPSDWPGDWRNGAAGEPDRFDDQRPPTIGLIEEFFLSEASPGIRQATLAAVDRLASAGAMVKRVPLPASFSAVHRHHRRLMARGAADAHRELFAAHRAQFGRHIADLIAEGLAVSDAQVAESLEHQSLFRRDVLALLRDVDVLVTPSTVTVAPGIETTGDPRFNSPWSYCGFPTVSLPCGLADDGLPASLQIAARPWLVERLFGAATWCESRVVFPEWRASDPNV